MVRQVLLDKSTMNALKFDLPLDVRKKIGPKVGFSRAVVPTGPPLNSAVPGRFTLENVKRSRPNEPAYCSARTVFWEISRSSDTLAKWTWGVSRLRSMPRTNVGGNTAAPASGPNVVVLSGIP